MSKGVALERLLRRDRVVALAGLALISAFAWAYILAGAGMDMAPMPMDEMMTGMAPQAWGAGYFALMLVMWGVMMLAMMLPSAAPMILLFGTIERRRRGASPHRAMALFASGYIAVWWGFSACATALQWALERLALLSPMMATTSVALAGVVLVATGIYQLTPLKHACLRHCRSPLEFISDHWRRGPFAMGIRHGSYCVGCCWALMGLLFVGGIMNLAWVAVIALFVIVEKFAPRGEWIGYAAGGGLIVWGGWTLSTILP